MWYDVCMTPTTVTLDIRVSGTTFYGALDPNGASEISKEEGWPEPTSRRIGKGSQYCYQLTRKQAEMMVWHLECLADGFAYSDQPETKAEGRKFRADAARIRKQLADVS